MAITSPAIDALEAAMQEAVAEFVVTVPPAEQPPVLYHYTDQAGLMGIMSSGSLFATQIQYLNDAEELRLATREIDGQLRERYERAPDEALRSLLDYTSSAAARGLSQRRCVVSFTEKGDQLGQWRGYCPDGTGFSIGFHSADLAEAAITRKIRGLPWSFAPVNYDPDAVVRFGAMAADHLVEYLRLLYDAGEDGRRVLERGINRFLGLATGVGPFLKHPAFAEEHEWRALSPPVPTGHGLVRHRPGGLTLRPYTLFELCAVTASMRFAEVICAPTTEEALVTDAAGSVLLEAGMQATVRASQVPYRTW